MASTRQSIAEEKNADQIVNFLWNVITFTETLFAVFFGIVWTEIIISLSSDNYYSYLRMGVWQFNKYLVIIFLGIGGLLFIWFSAQTINKIAQFAIERAGEPRKKYFGFFVLSILAFVLAFGLINVLFQGFECLSVYFGIIFGGWCSFLIYIGIKFRLAIEKAKQWTKY